jgi:hypothetical protein
MSVTLGTLGPTPFMTRGIIFRNDFIDTGSVVLSWTDNTDTGTTFFTNGDEMTVIGTGSGFIAVDLSQSGSPLVANNQFIIRVKSGSNVGDLVIYFYSGSLFNFAYTIQTTSFSNGNYFVFTGSALGYADKIVLSFGHKFVGFTSYIFDFVQTYQENIPLRYINNRASYSLKKRIVPQDAPMREQQIVQTLGSESPIVDLDGVFITDTDFTAQNYRDKLINVWQEGNYQWLQTDFIGAKFIVVDPAIDEVPGIINYYKWSASFIQYTPIGATLQNYNLS